MDKERLQKALEAHKNWLQNNKGNRADLSGADLCGADLCYANLRCADLRGADLRGADLRYANLYDANLPPFQICFGDLMVWKKIEGIIIKLEIPAEAKRTASLIGRKCRAEFADVLEIDDGKTTKVVGGYDPDFIYEVGKRIYPDKYDDDIRVECSNGIHFFLTREEAEEW